MPKKRERLVICFSPFSGSWYWTNAGGSGAVHMNGGGSYHRENAIRSARRFAKRFIEPPDVIIEE